VLGGDKNPNASSLIGKIPGLGGFMEKAFDVPYGATEIRLPGNAAIPFGEESFRTRAFYVTFMRTLRQMWTEKVDSSFATGLRAIGIDPNLAKKFRDIAVEAGINGNRRTFGRKMREAVSGATVYPNLRSMGVADELLPSATRDNINSLIDQANLENLDETIRKIRLNFAAQRRQAAQVLGTNPPPLGNASTEEQLAEATATVVANVQDAARRAGIDPTQATEAAKAVTQTTVNGLATLRNDIAARPSSPYVADMLADFFGDFEELRKAAFAKIDDASRRAIQQASPEGWAEKYYTTTEAWGVYADELATLIDDYRGRMMGVAQGVPYQAKRGTWDRIVRYLDLEEGGLQAQIGTALGKATPESAPEYEATIGAGRDLIFRRTATLMEVFGKYPTADNFDLLGETLEKMDEFGAAATAKIQGMHAGKMGQDAYNTARNRIQQQAIRDAADFIYNAAHTMASNGTPRATDEVIEAAVKQAESVVAKAAPTPIPQNGAPVAGTVQPVVPTPAPRVFAPTEGQKVYSASGDSWTLMKRNANGSWEASADARAEWQTITPEDFSKGRFTAEKTPSPASTFEPWKQRMPDWVASKVGANAPRPQVEAAMRQHYEAVKRALADGLSVPQEVVDDYPALVRQYRPQAPTPAPATPNYDDMVTFTPADQLQPKAATLLDVRKAQAEELGRVLAEIQKRGKRTATTAAATPVQPVQGPRMAYERPDVFGMEMSPTSLDVPEAPAAAPEPTFGPGGFFAETSEDLPLFSGAVPRNMPTGRRSRRTGSVQTPRPQPSTVSSQQGETVASLEEQRAWMREVWANVVAQQGKKKVPKLDTMVARYNRNGVVNLAAQGDFPYEDILGVDMGGVRFETETDIEKFLNDYVKAGQRIKDAKATLADTKTYAKMSEAEVRKAVGPILENAGISPTLIASSDRRSLLDMLEGVQGKDLDLNFGETYFTAGVVPLPSWQKFRDLWRRGRQTGNARTGTTGDAAQHVINTLDAAEAKVIDEVTKAVREGAPNTLTPQQRLRIIDLADRLSPEYDNMLATATEAGQKFADFAMLNFDNRMNIDTILAFILPYHYYWSRMPVRALAVALQKPQMVNFYYETKRAIQGTNQQENVPPRLEGTVPVYTADDGTQFRYPLERYLNNAIPGAMYFQPNPFVEPEQAEGNPVAQWILNQMKYTPGLLPAYQLGMYRWLDEVAPRQDGRKWTESWQMGDVAPLYRAYGEADKATGGALPGQLPEEGLLGTGDEFNPYRDGRGSIIVGMREKADPYTIYYAQMVEYNKQHGLKPNTHIPAEYLKPAQELAAKGEQFAGKERLLTVGSSYVGMPLYLYTNEEDQWRKMQETYFSLGYDENGNVAGSKEAGRQYIDENPVLPATWAKKTLIPGYKGTTPGQNAQFGQKQDEMDAMNDTFNAEREAYIAANPGVDYKTFDAFNDDWWERRKAAKAEIEAKYPDAAINSSEDRYRGMNPKELNEAATENARLQAEKDAGTPPVWPGNDASKAEKDAYYAAKEAYEGGVEKRLNELLGDMAWLDASVNGRLLGNPDAPVAPNQMAPRPPTLAPGATPRAIAQKPLDDPQFRSSGSFGQQPFGSVPRPGPEEERTLRVGPMTPLGKAPWKRTAEEVIKADKEKYFVPGEKELQDRFQGEKEAAQAEYDQWKPHNDAFYGLGDDWDAKRAYLEANPDFEEYLRKSYKLKGHNIWWLGEGGKSGKGGNRGNGKGSSSRGGAWGSSWDEYNELPDSAAKAAYLREHPEFAKYYLENYSGEDWWTNYAPRTSTSYSSTYAPRSYSSYGGGGSSGSSDDVQKQDIQVYVSPLGGIRTPEIRGWRPLPEAEMSWRQWASLLGPDKVQQWRGRG
jgi:hypothetical protein